MKIAAAIARYLLALMFLVFGANAILNFIPAPPMPDNLFGHFVTALGQAHYMVPVGVVMMFSGALFLINRFVPLALVLLGPVLVNILIVHILMAPATIGMGLFATLLWFVVFYQHRAAFAPLFRAKA
jgi:putative oxidoreductase